ncbi:hypothetical protein [Orientia tsutsugamushi]|nr:hypothetical protein [Orientia tsutsugamushi]
MNYFNQFRRRSIVLLCNLLIVYPIEVNNNAYPYCFYALIIDYKMYYR